MKSFSLIIFILPFILISCKNDESKIIDPNSNAYYNYYFTNDTMRVTFEIAGFTTSQPKLYSNTNFTSNNFFVKMNIQTISNGNMKVLIYKNEYDTVFNKIYSTVVNTIDSGTCIPALNKFEMIPTNFTGKGILTITKK